MSKWRKYVGHYQHHYLYDDVVLMMMNLNDEVVMVNDDCYLDSYEQQVISNLQLNYDYVIEMLPNVVKVYD
jgi:hypothetical protein